MVALRRAQRKFVFSVPPPFARYDKYAFVRLFVLRYDCPIVKPICPQYLCVAPPKNAAQCKLIPAKADASGCVGCPTYDCPVDCSNTACLAVVLTCDASKGLVLKKADGINQCCDACVEKPLCQPPPCLPPPANAEQCKFTPAKTDASGCVIGCPS